MVSATAPVKKECQCSCGNECPVGEETPGAGIVPGTVYCDACLDCIGLEDHGLFKPVPQCPACDEPLKPGVEQRYHKCMKHLAEDAIVYGAKLDLGEGGEVVQLVQVEETVEDGDYAMNQTITYETGEAWNSPDAGIGARNNVVVRVEIYPGVKARVLQWFGASKALVAWCYPWHKVLHWQEA